MGCQRGIAAQAEQGGVAIDAAVSPRQCRRCACRGGTTPPGLRRRRSGCAEQEPAAALASARRCEPTHRAPAPPWRETVPGPRCEGSTSWGARCHSVKPAHGQTAPHHTSSGKASRSTPCHSSSSPTALMTAVIPTVGVTARRLGSSSVPIAPATGTISQAASIPAWVAPPIASEVPACYPLPTRGMISCALMVSYWPTTRTSGPCVPAARTRRR